MAGSGLGGLAARIALGPGVRKGGDEEEEPEDEEEEEDEEEDVEEEEDDEKHEEDDEDKEHEEEDEEDDEEDDQEDEEEEEEDDEEEDEEEEEEQDKAVVFGERSLAAVTTSTLPRTWQRDTVTRASQHADPCAPYSATKALSRPPWAMNMSVRLPSLGPVAVPTKSTYDATTLDGSTPTLRMRTVTSLVRP